jgi:Putative prokaryotic signal transducing protein
VPALPFVPAIRVADAFHARVIAARLGSEGIVTQFRGGGVDGPYPMGAVEVLVSADQLAEATELLLADEVEDLFERGDDEPERAPAGERRPWFVVAVLASMALFALARSAVVL